MNTFTPGLAPLVKLTAQLHDVAQQIGNGVLAYEDRASVAYVRHELQNAAEHLTQVLESTRSGDDDPGLR